MSGSYGMCWNEACYLQNSVWFEKLNMKLSCFFLYVSHLQFVQELHRQGHSRAADNDGVSFARNNIDTGGRGYS